MTLPETAPCSSIVRSDAIFSSVAGPLEILPDTIVAAPVTDSALPSVLRDDDVFRLSIKSEATVRFAVRSTFSGAMDEAAPMRSVRSATVTDGGSNPSLIVMEDMADPRVNPNGTSVV